MRKILYLITTIAVIGLFTIPASDAAAQTSSSANKAMESNTSIRSAGIGPSSPLYFLDRFFESVGNIFVRSDEARAERYLRLAEERLSEAQSSAENATSTRKVLERYEKQQQKAFQNASSSERADVIGRVASATTNHLSVLDRVQEQVPEEAKDAIAQAKERSMQGQLSALNALSKKQPSKAAEISMGAAENRLKAAQNRAEAGQNDNQEAADVGKFVKEYQQFAEFGKGIRSLAQGLESGTTTPEEIVERATQKHLQVLQRVHDQAPPQARAGIQRAMLKSQQGQKNRPAPSPNRSATSTEAMQNAPQNPGPPSGNFNPGQSQTENGTGTAETPGGPPSDAGSNAGGGNDAGGPPSSIPGGQ